MSVKCPYCSSANISHPQTGTSVASCIGALGGAASAIYTAVNSVSKHSPYVFTATTIASLIVAGLAGGLSGSALGAQFGQELDSKVFTDYHCNRCNQKFSPVIALN